MKTNNPYVGIIRVRSEGYDLSAHQYNVAPLCLIDANLLSNLEKAKYRRIKFKFKFVNNLLTNYILLIIKLIPALGILDVSNGKACLTGESRFEVKTETIEERTSPFCRLMKP